MHHCFFLSGQGTFVPPSVVLPFSIANWNTWAGVVELQQPAYLGLLDFHPQRAQRAAKTSMDVKIEQYGAWGVLAGGAMHCCRYVSGEQRTWHIVLGVFSSCSFHGERMKLNWWWLGLWLGGIWVRSRGSQKQVSCGTLLFLFVLWFLKQRRLCEVCWVVWGWFFSLVFLPYSSV